MGHRLETPKKRIRQSNPLLVRSRVQTSNFTLFQFRYVEFYSYSCPSNLVLPFGMKCGMFHFMFRSPNASSTPSAFDLGRYTPPAPSIPSSFSNFYRRQSPFGPSFLRSFSLCMEYCVAHFLLLLPPIYSLPFLPFPTFCTSRVE